MLVLSRKQSEKILIGEDITITVCRISAVQVRIGIEAPPDVNILRKELGHYQNQLGCRASVKEDESSGKDAKAFFEEMQAAGCIHPRHA